MPFRVGFAIDPQPEDRVFDTEQEALEKGRKMADAFGWNTAIAIWDEADEPLWIFLIGGLFKRTT
jgi:hypothetical protein